MPRVCAQNSAHDYAGQNACRYRREYGVVLSCAVGARENMGASSHECGDEHTDGGAEEYAYDRAQKRVSSVAHNRTPLLSAPRQGRAYRFAFPAMPKAIPVFAQTRCALCGFVCADAPLAKQGYIIHQGIRISAYNMCSVTVANALNRRYCEHAPHISVNTRNLNACSTYTSMILYLIGLRTSGMTYQPLSSVLGFGRLRSTADFSAPKFTPDERFSADAYSCVHACC